MNGASNFCTKCGVPLGANARFCASCGAAVVPLSKETEAASTYTAPPVNIQPPVAQPPVYQAPPASQPIPPVYQAPPPPQPPPPVYQQPDYPPPQEAYYTPPQATSSYGYQPPPAGIPGEMIIGIIPNATKKKNLIMSETYNIIVTNHRMICALMTSEMIKEESARHRGEGVGGFFKAMGSGYNLWQRYLQMPPEIALQENPGNFAIYMSQIRGVKFKPDTVLFSKGGVSVGFKGGFGGGDDDDKNTKPLEIDTIAGKYKFEINDMYQQQIAETLRKAGLIR